MGEVTATPLARATEHSRNIPASSAQQIDTNTKNPPSSSPFPFWSALTGSAPPLLPQAAETGLAMRDNLGEALH